MSNAEPGTGAKAPTPAAARDLGDQVIVRAGWAKMLLGVTRKLASRSDLDGMLETFAALATEALGAERTSVFLHDEETGELWARVAEGVAHRRIRMLDTAGIAGHVFTTGEPLVIDDAYADARFNRDIDQRTGFLTRNLLTVPIRTAVDRVIGVVQVLNKKEGGFTADDLRLLEAITRQAAAVLHGAHTIERMQASRQRELEFLDLVADITSEIDLRALLAKVMAETTRLLNAERSTLFLNDEKTGELWSQVGEGLGAFEIRFPNHRGIAGAVFTSGQSVNIPHAYADLRFNPAVDRQTGFFTRSILCTPVVNKQGKIIGVTQVLNKKGGPFVPADEARLRAFTAQIAIALENAKLFNDVQNMKNYNQSMLESMSNGVVTLDEGRRVASCNLAGRKILGVRLEAVLGRPAAELFAGPAAWVLDLIERVEASGQSQVLMDSELPCAGGTRSVNLTVLPLTSVEGEKLGTLLMLEDISSEKRMKSTMSRYMDPRLADQLLAGGEDILGGRDLTATILFSDVRGFTPLTEALGAQGTVSLLNEYFTLMVDVIQHEGGMLDKFIGDAIMAAFGIPVAREDDEDRAVRAAIRMIEELQAWNRQRASRGLRTIDIGIGLSTGQVVSGNIGSPKRMDYTVMGDGVNLASRLEGACKQYHARILLSESTVRRLRGTYRLRDVDDVIVKGKTEPVTIYEVLDYHSPESFPQLMEAVQYFREGRRLYRSGNWAGASRHFVQALELNPEDRLAELYLERCHSLQADPPAEWNGVWVMKTK